MKTTRFLSLGLAAGLFAVASPAYADSLLEKIATVVLADKFGIDTREIIVIQQQTRLPVYELAPLLEASYHLKQRPATVWQLREQGLGWGQIAQRVGMHPGTFNKLRNQGAFDRDRFWTSSYRERFSVPDDQIAVIRQRGGTLEDVLAAIIVGKLTNKSPQDIYARYQIERSWATVASVANVSWDQWQKVSAPPRNRYNLGELVSSASKGKTTPPGKLNRKSAGKGNGQGGGKGNGKGKGKGG